MLRSPQLILLGPLLFSATLVAQENAPDESTKKAIDQLKKDVCVQLERLLAFKRNPDFKKYGFGRGGPYHKWLTDVEALRDAQPKGFKHPIPLALRAARGELMMLGMEYMQKQKETEYTREILPELKATIHYAAYLANKKADQRMRSLRRLRTWTDRTGKYSVKAKCIAYVDGQVTLQKTNDDKVVVPLTKLSDKDRALIESAYPQTEPKTSPDNAAEQTDEPKPE